MKNKILTITFVWACIGLMLVGGCAKRLSMVKVTSPYNEIQINATEDVNSMLYKNRPTCY